MMKSLHTVKQSLTDSYFVCLRKFFYKSHADTCDFFHYQIIMTALSEKFFDLYQVTIGTVVDSVIHAPTAVFIVFTYFSFVIDHCLIQKFCMYWINRINKFFDKIISSVFCGKSPFGKTTVVGFQFTFDLIALNLHSVSLLLSTDIRKNPCTFPTDGIILPLKVLPETDMFLSYKTVSP